MAQSNWEADKMLDVYIHDYMLKRKFHASAKAFMAEGKVATEPVAIDAPGGFLFEWWSVFWDIFIARTKAKHSDAAAAYIEVQQVRGREQQQFLRQQLQLLPQRNAQLLRRDPNPTLGGSVNNVNSEGTMGQPSPSLLAMKMYGEHTKHPHSVGVETSPAVIDANRMAHIKAATDCQGQLIQANPVSMPSSLQQIPPQLALATDVKSEINLGATQKALTVDPSLIYGQAILQSKSGLNQGPTGLPLKGWPLTGVDQIRPNVGGQMQKCAQPNENLFISTSQQQQPLAQPLAQSSLGNPNILSDMDSQRFGGLPRGGSNGKDNQYSKIDGSTCFPVRSSLPKNRKRKQNISSGAAISTGTGPCPSPSSPPSTHTGDGVNTGSSLQHINGEKSMAIHATDGSGGPTTSTNLMEDVERFGDVGSLDDNMESLLSHESGDGSNIDGTLKESLPEQQKESSKNFTFGEVGCIRTRNSKVTCCHFSSNGKLLASAGHDKKVVIWNMDTLQTVNMPEEHKSVITDIRFRPNSSQLATASVDKSVRLWDAAHPNFCSHAYTLHSSPVMSLDFHPRKTELLCFCDNNNEIRYWSVNPFSCTRISKGGTAQVRFQPIVGQLLAAASDKVVTIFDVETYRHVHSLQGHPDLVNYICWDASGDCLASVSHNLVKIWSLTRGDCIRELSSSLELWNIAENKKLTVRAHENIISALAQSPATGMVASASHDCSVKIWK